MNLGNELKQSHKKVFGKYVDGSSSKDRLEDLLQKIENYTRFLLVQNQKARNKSANRRVEDAQEFARSHPKKQPAIGGKMSASKRRGMDSQDVNSEPDDATDNEE